MVEELRKWLDASTQCYRIARVARLPAVLAPDLVYLVGKPRAQSAVMMCPCGCSTSISLPLQHQSGAPAWRMCEQDGMPTLEPSIANQAGCHSHFFLHKGRVRWLGECAFLS